MQRSRVKCHGIAQVGDTDTVGICGELAADEALTEAFLRLGVDELSVAPSRILPLREKIRSLTLG